MKKFALFTAAALLLLPINALAMPDMAKSGKGPKMGPEERFAAMDADKDGKVTWEEFSAAHPQMSKAAFETIDKSKDGFIVKEEWMSFSSGHTRDMGQSGGSMGGPMGGQTGGMGMPGGAKGPSAADDVGAPAPKVSPDHSDQKKKDLPLLPMKE